MFTPMTFFAPQGGVDLVPVTGYSAYIDFKDSPITLNGSNISQIDDLSGNGYHAVQATTAQQPYWNPAGYYDGQSTSNQRWLNWSTSDAIFNARSPRTNDYELVVGVSENPHRHVIGGLGSSANDRVEFFMNDDPGRRDGIAMPRQYFFYSTNDTSKDIILFNSTTQTTLNIYGYMQTLQNGSNTPAWAGDTFSTTGRIGRSARNQNLPGDGWQGKIYFYLVYPRTLTSQERIDIRDWAVNKWGLTLT